MATQTESDSGQKFAMISARSAQPLCLSGEARQAARITWEPLAGAINLALGLRPTEAVLDIALSFLWPDSLA
jgi:hypothetical protein